MLSRRLYNQTNVQLPLGLKAQASQWTATHASRQRAMARLTQSGKYSRQTLSSH